MTKRKSVGGRAFLAMTATALLGAAALTGAPPAAADDDNCIPSCGDGGDGGVFSGALAHPGDGEVYAPPGGGGGGGGSAQPKYEWRVTEICRDEEGEPGRGNCQPHIDPCLTEYGDDNDLGDLGQFEVMYRSPGGGEWTTAAYGCWGGEDELVTVEEIAEDALADWEALAPPIEASIQPPGGRALIDLPVYFHSGQPQRMEPTTVNAQGFAVTVWASGRWHWQFDAGVTRRHEVPGSTYTDPNPVVVHTYHAAGTREINLTTEWWGTFTVDGEGPWEIETPATQTADPITLNVVELSSVLSGR